MSSIRPDEHPLFPAVRTAVGRVLAEKLGDIPDDGITWDVAVEAVRVLAAQVCSVQGCSRPHHAKGLCHAHYQAKRLQDKSIDPCTVEGCDRARYARGLCWSHYRHERSWSAEPCTVEGCSRPEHARGLCRTHYQADRRRTNDPCSVEGCNRGSDAKGLCHAHYQAEWRRRRRAVEEQDR